MTSRLQGRMLAQRALFQRLSQAKKRGSLQAGFTLIELLIVIVIIGILSAIAIPNFLSQKEKAQNASLDSWASASARACSALKITESSTDIATKWTDVKANPPSFKTPAPTNTCTSGADSFAGAAGTWTVGSDGKVTPP